MESYVQHAPCLFFVTSDNGTLLDVNDYLCESLQYSRRELLGLKPDVFFSVATRIFQQTHFYPLLKMQGHAEEIYLTLLTKDGGQLPVLINAERKVLEGEAVNLHVGIVVHNRKKFEDELIAAKKSAEAALHENSALLQAKQELQRHSEELDRQIQLVYTQNEELKQFGRVVTHDMQEPLRKLSVFADLLQQHDRSETETDRLMEKIGRITQQLKALLSGLQQYVWLTETPLVPSAVDLSRLLLEMQQQLADEHKDVQVRIEASTLQPLAADLKQMRLLFYEILSNAIRFRRETGKVYVAVSAETLHLNQFHSLEGKYKFVEFIRIQVKDQGIGLPQAYTGQVFELFKRFDAKSGRGIGLSLCKQVVNNHGGSITLESEPGEGTLVTIVLPLHPRGEEAKPALEPPQTISNKTSYANDV